MLPLQELLAGDVDLDAWVCCPVLRRLRNPSHLDELLGGDDFGFVVRGVQPVIRHVSFIEDVCTGWQSYLQVLMSTPVKLHWPCLAR
jgi:hypothetical protein